ncbi:hypothetical protein FQA39_LY15870 [Lamprigera yunnana]|nr:hypothetical protein FQA39_LY15870 [Lamprigera yunnana]
MSLIDNAVIRSLKNKDDWRMRLKGLEELNKLLRDPKILKALEPKASSLLCFLFGCEQHNRLQSAAEDIIKIIISNMTIEVIRGRLNQIATALCKMGSPAGVRLSILLMRRITADEFLNQLLSNSILGAKSSKIREGALQILMTISRIFPSTEVNVPKSVEFVTPLLHDRKKRVRRASLETIATLAQFGSPSTVLDIISRKTYEYSDKEQLIRVIRARLSRKQLPAVDLNGSVRYSTPCGDSELEWISIGSATTSPSSAQSNDVPVNATNVRAETARLDLGHLERVNYWKSNARRVQSGSDVLEHDEESDWSRDSINKVEKTLLQWANECNEPSKETVVTVMDSDFTTTCDELAGPSNHDDGDNSNPKVFIFFHGNPIADNTRVVMEEDLQENESNTSNNLGAVDENFLNNNTKQLSNLENMTVPDSDPEDNWAPSYRIRRLNQSYDSSTAVLTNQKLRVLSYPILPGTSKWCSAKQLQDENKSQNMQIWAVDPWTLSASVKLSSSNGTLRPLYFMQKENALSNSTNSADSNKARSPRSRGRSYSPPKKIFDTDKNEERERFIAVSKDEEDFQNLHKSISSDHLRNSKSFLDNTSSSNSDISIRTGNWHKSFKSAIPVPVSSDSRFRFRTRSNDVCKGPLSIPTHIFRTKSPTPQRTPERKLISQRSVLVRQPFSSDSESSEFFTPPAEPHLVTQHLEEPRQTESFIEVGTPIYHNENFTVIESAPDVLEENKTFSRANSARSRVESVNLNVENLSLDEAQARNDTDDSFQTQDEFEEEQEAHDQEVDEIRTLQTITINETFNVQKTYLENNLSKSEVNLQISTEVSRKSVNSAPPLNESNRNVENTKLPISVTEFLPQHTIKTEIRTTPKSTKNPLVRQLSRKNSIRCSKRESASFLDHANPFVKPKEGFNETMALLEHNDWEMTMKGLQGMARLTRHHPELCDLHMHAICVALGKHIKNLRSQVARAACSVASEMFSNHKRSLELELEEIVVPLLHRTADTNKFLRSDANEALDKMCLHMAPPRIVSIVTTRGGGHQNAIVRCTAARLLGSLTNRLGAEKVFQLPKDTRDKILLTGANMLMEGNLDTRKHAKMMFGNLIGHSQFHKAMTEAVPVCTIRHIQKTLKSLQ